MASYLIIESREASETFGDADFSEWLTGLVALGHQATVFLTQNAVVAARPGAAWNDDLTALQEAGVTIECDDFYAVEKSIGQLHPGVERVGMGHVVERVMAPGTRTVWH